MQDVSKAPAVRATATRLPAHRYSQSDLASLARDYLPSGAVRDGAIERFFARVGVDERYFALPIERYRSLRGLRERNDAWLDVATDLGQQVIERVLAEAELDPHDVNLLATTTVTGVAVPSLDARLMNRIPFAPGLKRMPLFGLGCLGGAAGLARVADYLRGAPTEAALLLSVELCSLTFQPSDGSVANIVSSGLFGDGASAVLVVGSEHRLASTQGPRVLTSRSVFFPGTERVMGWDVVDTGFQVVLSNEVPNIVEEHLPRVVDNFLNDNGLVRADVGVWVMHPGGPKVIDAMTLCLGLEESDLSRTRSSLRRVGNLSSSSVLFLLDERCRGAPPMKGTHGILLAMGPGFCAELVLLSW